MPSSTKTFCTTFILYLFVLPANTKAQTTTSANNFSQENIHIHFDKDIYLPGETIWFKAYLYSNGLPSLSTNFYAALYDENGKLLQQKQYPIFGNSCNGDFVIADSLHSKQLQFRAFTKAMWFTDSNNIYQKIISIGSVYKNLKQSSNKVALQFYPEGGQAVSNLANYIAFKALDDSGNPALIKGTIIDEANNAIDSFFANELGLGKLQMIIEKNKKYTALWQQPDGKTERTVLPEVIEVGALLHTEILKNNIYYTVNKNTVAENFDTLRLLAQMGNEELYKSYLVLNGQTQFTGKFATDSFPTGVMQLTLFDKQWNMLQQKDIFIDADKSKSQPSITITQQSLQPKANNSIEVTFPDTLQSNLSISITDVDFYDAQTHHAIEDDVLYAALLKDSNENIANFAEIKNNSVMDMVMLTHRWRRYNWQDSLNKPIADVGVIDNYLSLSGFSKYKKDKFNSDDLLSLVIKDTGRGKQFYNITTADGKYFKKGGLLFYGEAKVYYQYKQDKERSSDFKMMKIDTVAVPLKIAALQNETFNNVVKDTIQQLAINAFVINSSNKFNATKTMKEVLIRSRKVSPITKRILELDDKYTSGLFSGIARGYQFDVLGDAAAQRQSDVLSYIKYRVPRLTTKYISANAITKLIYIEDARSPDPHGPAIFVNESQLPDDVDLSTTVPISQIAYIKYIDGIVLGSSGSYESALYIYTKKGDEVDISENTTMPSIIIKGYNDPKDFLSPDYTDKKDLNKPDLRSTVYWNPYLIKDNGSNKLKIDFYNNDISKKLLVTIEGVNNAGELIHIEKVIE